MKRTSGLRPSPGVQAGKHRVLIVVDHPVTRFGVAALVNQQRDLVVCGEADGPPGAADLVRKLAPDLAIVDLAHGTIGGIELIRQIKILRPTMRVLVISMQDENIYAERALRAGAAGYIMKKQPVDDILTAIRRVLSGELSLSEEMKEKMIHRAVKGSKEQVVSSIDSLTDREMEVFRLLGNGDPTSEIASKLHLSVKTIDSHREHLKRKLGIGNGADLVRHAIQWAKSEKLA